ncbi:site-specific DNA-methyltransferase [Brevibacillus migulae]|uniref:site-specific DNA-methyltransferase n=1 Tax=Brevibacillus migulae TaxID=1644114 RepID=UPI00106E8537|nr:site-specific DNA-methyltransferase [Brevibacillus migulae]
MNKLSMRSKDLTQENIDKIAVFFPNVITEARDENGKITRAIDFDLLKQELSDVLVEGEKERYQLTWPGKKEAILNANTPIEKTLRPIKNDSVDWDNTQNIYIEGDNLEVLKLLQESYLNKIKCIYIDPPYNTGKDFIYKDDFKEPLEEYLEESGQIDNENNRLFLNTESNGRFHSDWLTMMYSRLKIARNLLKEDGVIFISIDDNEVTNLSKICNEIFGEKNFIANVAVVNNLKGRSDEKYIATAHESLLIYQKGNFETYGVPLPEEYLEEYKLEDEKGRYRLQGLRKRGDSSRREDRPQMYYPFYYDSNSDTISLSKTSEECIEILPKLSDGSDGRWRWGKDTAEKNMDLLTARLVSGRNEYDIFQKDYMNDGDNIKTVKPKSFWLGNEFSSDSGTLAFKQLFGRNIFQNPKPLGLIKYILSQATKNDDIILDFYSGSATSAHAVMQLNAEDGGKRKYMMVQLPEETNANSEANKAGYKTICEIGKERIRRAAKKIKEETGADIDYGFRVYRVDSSNMKDVYYTPDELGQMNLEDLTSNIKEDRTGEDLLIQVMLETGLELSLPMESKQIEGKTIYCVAGNSLIACFDEDVSESLIKKIAEEKPLRVVFRDSAFSDDSARINVEELFKMLSPSTEIQVL